MRLQIASDLHIDNLRRPPRFGGLAPAAADVLILAGDIHRGSAAVDMFAQWPFPVLYVLGNHEFYGQGLRELEQEVVAKASGTSVEVLANRETFRGGLRFLGSTLWTDFRLNRSHKKSMREAASSGDYKAIMGNGGTRFTPEDALNEHLQSRDWLEKALQKPFHGPTVVITHHAPGRESLGAGNGRTRGAASFASDLSELAGRADLWIHGHVHRTCNYRLWGCQVLCNPRGRPIAQSGSSVLGTNRSFEPEFVHELKTGPTLRVV